MRIANLNPGTYNVTVFEKVEPTTPMEDMARSGWMISTARKSLRHKTPVTIRGERQRGCGALGTARTVTVTVKAGEYLWFAEMEDNSGGISGMIIRSVDAAPPVVDVSASKALFKIDFGHLENERIPTDADGNPAGRRSGALEGLECDPDLDFRRSSRERNDGFRQCRGHSQCRWHSRDLETDRLL